jgi:[acyl-carrier-protein] S-malonyltransferase
MGFKTLKNSWVFPGQASQKVGMGLDFYENTDLGKNYYDLANDILGEDIKDISFNGPDEKLKITKFTQPAIFIVSTIISHLLLEKGYNPDGVAGHSLGEYSALAAAGGIDFETGLELVKVRSNSMDNAGKLIPGTMAAVIGMDRAKVKELTQELSSEQIVVAANYNTENQIVISGNIETVKDFIDIAKENGARMAIPLNVSGAFHSPLMKPAREELADKLDSIEITDINIPIYSNVNAKPTRKGSDIKKSLINQLENPVLWFDSINNMVSDGFSKFTEIGPGKVLCGLNKKINKDLFTNNIESYRELESYEI